jgi:hypothetical protein
MYRREGGKTINKISTTVLSNHVKGKERSQCFPSIVSPFSTCESHYSVIVCLCITEITNACSIEILRLIHFYKIVRNINFRDVTLTFHRNTLPLFSVYRNKSKEAIYVAAKQRNLSSDDSTLCSHCCRTSNPTVL